MSVPLPFPVAPRLLYLPVFSLPFPLAPRLLVHSLVAGRRPHVCAFTFPRRSSIALSSCLLVAFPRRSSIALSLCLFSLLVPPMLILPIFVPFHGLFPSSFNFACLCGHGNPSPAASESPKKSKSEEQRRENGHHRQK